MPRGCRTDIRKAATIKAMAEAGFQTGLISHAVGMPANTVNDILNGRHGWDQLAEGELFIEIRLKVKNALESVSDNLAEKVIARIEQKIAHASILEASAIYQALTGKRRSIGWTETKREKRSNT